MVLLTTKKVALKRVVTFHLSWSYGEIVYTIASIGLIVKRQNISPEVMSVRNWSLQSMGPAQSLLRGSRVIIRDAGICCSYPKAKTFSTHNEKIIRGWWGIFVTCI